MNGIGASDLLQAVIATAARGNAPEEGDYLDDDGFLRCGKCHTRKQAEIELDDPENPGQKHKLKVPASCECRRRKLEAEREEERRQKELERIRYLREQSGIEDDEELKDATFDTFETTKHNGRALKLCRRYADGFDEMVKKNQGLLFYGNVGTGKSYAAACIANTLLNRGVPVVVTSFVKLIDAMQTFKEEDEVVLRRTKRARLLILDDLSSERDTSFALEKVYNIIDSRYRARLPVIITTNLSMDEMKGAAEIRYARIYDRIFEMCYPMEFTGPSWRKRKASRRFDEFEAFLEGTE